MASAIELSPEAPVPARISDGSFAIGVATSMSAAPEPVKKSRVPLPSSCTR
jgi:hypothetical protein